MSRQHEENLYRSIPHSSSNPSDETKPSPRPYASNCDMASDAGRADLAERGGGWELLPFVRAAGDMSILKMDLRGYYRVRGPRE